MKKKQETYYVFDEMEFIKKIGIKEKTITAITKLFDQGKPIIEVYVK